MTATMTAPDTARLTAASAMQKLLPELVALGLDAKQIHWNVIGPAFSPLHALTDELAADTGSWADRIAERAVALGFPVDARPRTVAAVGVQIPAGWTADQEAIAQLIDRLDDVIGVARASLADVGEADAVAHDLTVTVLEGLEKYRWMFRAQAA